jgi:hypothetical protein
MKNLENNVFFLLGDSLASEFYANIMEHSDYSIVIGNGRCNRQSVLKCWHIKFRRQIINQKKEHNIQTWQKFEIKNLENSCPSVISTTIDPIQTGLGPNPFLDCIKDDDQLPETWYDAIIMYF